MGRGRGREMRPEQDGELCMHNLPTPTCTCRETPLTHTCRATEAVPACMRSDFSILRRCRGVDCFLSLCVPVCACARAFYVATRLPRRTRRSKSGKKTKRQRPSRIPSTGRRLLRARRSAGSGRPWHSAAAIMASWGGRGVWGCRLLPARVARGGMV